MTAATSERPPKSALFAMKIQLALVLAFLFAGIWISDAEAFARMQPAGGVLSMRLTSLATYSLVFLLATFYRPKNYDFTSPMTAWPRVVVVTILVGMALFILGGILTISSFSETPQGALCALVLLKCVGAPVSIALAVLFTRLPQSDIAGISALGMSGAFLIQECAKALALNGWLSPLFLFSVGMGLLIATCFLVIIGGKQAFRASRIFSAEASERHTFQLKEVITINLGFGTIVAALILGFQRSADPSDLQAAVFAAIACIVAIVLSLILLHRFELYILFRSAVVCTVAGYLLTPLFAFLSTQGVGVVIGAGMALCEGFVWAVVVFVARACTNPVAGAAAARLLAVIGHLVGSFLAFFATYASIIYPQAQNTAQLLIVFFFVVMLLCLFNGSNKIVPLRPLNKGHEGLSPAALGNKLMSRHSRTSRGEADVAADVEADVAAEEVLSDAEDIWLAPCSLVAERCGLTARETEVLMQLAQGRDIAFMEEKFILSRNTIKMHIKHVYAKLGVHSKQEVINIVNEARAES